MPFVDSPVSPALSLVLCVSLRIATLLFIVFPPCAGRFKAVSQGPVAGGTGKDQCPLPHADPQPGMVQNYAAIILFRFPGALPTCLPADLEKQQQHPHPQIPVLPKTAHLSQRLPVPPSARAGPPWWPELEGEVEGGAGGEEQAEPLPGTSTQSEPQFQPQTSLEEGVSRVGDQPTPELRRAVQSSLVLQGRAVQCCGGPQRPVTCVQGSSDPALPVFNARP